MIRRVKESSLYPEPMVKCVITASKRQLSTVINTLYDLGLYHIKPHQKGTQNLDIGQPLTEVEDLSAVLVKVRSILSLFEPVAPRKIPAFALTASRWRTAQKGIASMYAKVMEAQDRAARIVDEEKHYNLQLTLLGLLQQSGISLAALQKSQHLCFFLGEVQRTEGIDAAFALYERDLVLRRKENCLLAVASLQKQKRVEELLHQFGFTSATLDILEKAGKAGEVEISRLRRKLDLLSEEKKKIQKLHATVRKELPILASLEIQIQEEIKKKELPLSFAVTQSSFIAEGWIPKEFGAKVQESLEAVTDNLVHVEITEPHEHDNVPVKLHNKKLVTPFEFFLRLYDLPRYTEIDPTSLLFITFPIFFGFMLGDVGYGLILLLLFIYLKKKIPAAKALASILIFAASVSIFFGFVFGEYLGFEYVGAETGKALCDAIDVCLHQGYISEHGEQVLVYEFPRVLSRVHSHMNILGYEVLSVLVIGAIIGFLHLNFGLILGFLNELHHGFAHAFFAKISWIVLEAGIIIAVLASMNIIANPLSWLGIAVAVAGIIMLGLGEGVRGFIEIPALFSTMLSYMRLGAVGLASVGLAVVVNEKLAAPFFHKGGLYILLGVLIMLFGHGINILLGVIGPFLHGIRLHYVEFFSKFYQGGGEEYQPFAAKVEGDGK